MPNELLRSNFKSILMKPIKSTLAFICFFFCAVYAQAQGKSSAVKIYGMTDKTERSKVMGLLQIDHFQMTADGALLTEIDERELAKLRATYYRYDIVVDDISANLEAMNRQYYIDRANGVLPEQNRMAFEQPGGTLNNIITTPAAFQVKATFGGYYQFSEMNTAMNNLVAAYPALVQKVSLGKSTENRDIWCIKISDNAAVDEANEPEVLFTGLTHAREAIGGSSMIFLMQYLCENYATDTRIRDLVNNREIFIIPCTNPDGWQHNFTLNNNGGGLWRKNRRVNGGGEFGVDLNRNWSVDWANCSAPISGNPGSCGSSSTASDTYWGPSSFSEPETKAIRDFTYTRHFVTMIDQHSYGPYYSLPFGRPSLPTNVMDPLDNKFYTYVSAAMGNYNGMRAGNTFEALNYESAGTIKDWMLKGNIGTGTKGKVLGMTSEGATGTVAGGTFWPPAAQIINLCKGLIYQNVQLIYAAGSYINLQDQTDINLSSKTGTFDFNAIRVGIDNQPVDISVIPLQNIQSVGSALTINSMPNYYDTYNGNISYTLPASLTNGQKIKFAWKIETGGIIYYDTITKFYNATQMLYDNMDGSYASNWTGTNGWNFTSAGTGYGGGSSKAMSESPAGIYTASSTRRSAYNNPLDLSDATAAYISFWVKHRAENFRDKLQLQVSTNSTDGVNGTWTAIKGTTTVQESGNLDGNTLNGLPALTGIKEDWTREIYDLNSYLGASALRFRFEFTSDANTSGFAFEVDDGFYIDNLKFIKSTAPLVILAVRFVTITGKLTPEKAIKIQWEAETDQFHSYFEVEKSTDQQSFTSIQRVQGTDPYEALDRNPSRGNNYYRIRQVNTDGSAAYSKIINVVYDPFLVTMVLYPNPVKDKLSMKINTIKSEVLTVNVADLTGRVIYTQQISVGNTGQEIQIDVRSWSSQVYILKVVNSNNETVNVQKFVKQ
jgi:carboxypeptidase T